MAERITRKPRLTERVLEGLTEAYNRMEADDLTDLEGDDLKDFDAAGKWIRGMWAHRNSRERSRQAKTAG